LALESMVGKGEIPPNPRQQSGNSAIPAFCLPLKRGKISRNLFLFVQIAAIGYQSQDF
jgi:hypothetical protein